MASETVRIGGASGFWGDSRVAVPQLLRDGNVDYLVFDYLAELTMSILAAARIKNPSLGYATDFVDVTMRGNLKAILEADIRVVSNAGGVNPQGCAAALAAIAAEMGLSPKIAVVEGDDALPLVPELRKEDVREFQRGAPMPVELLTASAYLGALPIKQALDAGADIVLTGRCVDSAVTLGVLMHRFGWTHAEYDKLAMGSLAGHIIECGCQGTGGLHTDWRDVPRWAEIGYPIIEAATDGSFSVTKPSDSGGLVSTASISEQILYEVGDPASYVLPDVICDFTQVQLEQEAADRVSIRGARGRAPTDTYKVCATYADGYRCTGQLSIVGFEAAAKAKRTAESILERTREIFRQEGLTDYSDTLIEVIGAESVYGPHSAAGNAREVIMRLAVVHPDRRSLGIFAREIAPAGTSWAPGTAAVGGRPDVSKVIKQFSFLLEKARLRPQVVMDGKCHPVEIPQGRPAGVGVQSRALVAPTPVKDDGDMVEVPLIAVAYGRSGDKGDACNVGIIARRPELLPHLRAQVTEDAVAQYLGHLVKGPVTRYDVPGIHALNFVCDQALGGGGMASLRIDPWGKGMAQILLSMPVVVPRRRLVVETSVSALVDGATIESAHSNEPKSRALALSETDQIRRRSRWSTASAGLPASPAAEQEAVAPIHAVRDNGRA